MGVDQAIDLTAEHRKTVLELLERHLPDTAAWVYGSRVKWTSRPQSDLDLVVFATPEQGRQVGDLREAFEESNLPFRVDLFVWDDVPESFRDRIKDNHVVVTKPRAPERHEYRGANEKWDECRLGELTENFDSIRVPVKRADRAPGPYPYYGASGIVDHVAGYLFDGEYLLVAEDGENLRTRNTPIAFLANGKFWVNNRAHVIRANRRADTRFLMYALSQLDISGYVTGSTMPKLTQDNMNRIRVRVPVIREQRGIAHILGTLDNKIDLNRRLNATLEAMARTLFRSWFVEFDPVRAKVEGRDTGLPKDIADLFPDQLVDSELGAIPLRWPVESLADHFDAMKGVSYKGSGLAGGDGAPLHNLNSIHEGGGYKYEGIKFYSGEYAERHRVRPGDVIVANTEQGHDRLLIGYAAIVPGLFGTDGIASHHIYRLRPRSASWLTTRFLLFLLNSARMHDLVSGYANGTTVNMLPIDWVQRPSIVVPPQALVETFEVVVSCSEHRREQIVRESRALTDLREALLPKLVSGEIQVRDAEKLVGATA